MRLQLALVAIALAIAPAVASADGSLSVRGVYYKERSTRVMQPMLDGIFDVGTRGLVTGHFLVDAITSASSGSGAANAMPFTERRYEAGGSYTHELDGPAALPWMDLARITGEAKYSTESDYTSLYIGTRLETEIAQKNALLGVAGGVSSDTITNAGAQGPMGGPLLACDAREKIGTETQCALTSYVASATASQIVSKNAVVGVVYDVAKLSGFQSNAYRQVITDGGLVPERHPNSRFRQSVAASVRYYVPATQTTFIGAYRFYHDSWHINAHTPEIRIVQEVGAFADASVRFRYYTQSAAFFFEKRYPDPNTHDVPFLTDDPKMSAFNGALMEAKLGVFGEEFGMKGRWSGTRFEGVLEYIIQHNRFGDAVVAHVAVTVPFDY